MLLRMKLCYQNILCYTCISGYKMPTFFCQIKGTNFIKELYHRLDPSIALPNAVDITGEIQVAMKYNREEKLLLLKLIQARELVPRDVIGYSDPYAVIKIVPDR